MRVERFPSNPIITPAMGERMGSNINGPSLIRVPDWVENPLGRYYLYFGHHKGQYIRLAYADNLAGPWTVYDPGTLHLEQTPCHHHIASPDVLVDEENQQIRMYYHGPYYQNYPTPDRLEQRWPMLGGQRSLLALSKDGLNFESGNEVFGPSYFRVFRWQGLYYALGMPGIFYRSETGLTDFEAGPVLFTEAMRHAALRVINDDTLEVYYSNSGDKPERILRATLDLRVPWPNWQASDPITVLEPETDYEGVTYPLEASERGWIDRPVRQLRDPAIFVEAGETYLIYAVAGENGLAIARLDDSGGA